MFSLCRILSLALAFSILLAPHSFGAESLKYQPRAFAFRLHQGFFNLASGVLEDALKAAGYISPKNVITFSSSRPMPNFLQYSAINTAFKLENGRLLASLRIEIQDSNFYISETSNCRVQIAGRLAFQVLAGIQERGAADVSLANYDASGMTYSNQNCGVFERVGISLAIQSNLEKAIKAGFDSVVNGQELRYVQQVRSAKKLLAMGAFVNQIENEWNPAKINPNSVNVEGGILGYLSNSREADSVSIENPKTPYVNQIGMDWVFAAGILAGSRNVYDPRYVPTARVSGDDFPAWGRAPKEKLGAPVNFDAAFMVKENFIQSIFQTLFQAGLFNIRAQQSLLPKDGASLSPFQKNFSVPIIKPDGHPFTKEEFGDARISLRFANAPDATFREPNEVDHSVPAFEMAYEVKTRTDSFFPVAKFKAAFHLVAKVEFSQENELGFAFNERPLEKFVMLDRSGL